MPEDLHWKKYAGRFKTYELGLPPSANAVDMVVCIPVYAEPDVITTLDSLLMCSRPACKVEVLLLFNQSNRMTLQEKDIHQRSWSNVLAWIDTHQSASLLFIPVYVDQMPDPKGGVGWARKLVMDEAAKRLHQEGILLCLDADCRVAGNYLSEVYDHFARHPEADAASIYFEHPLDGLAPGTRKAIIQYELHLRYLVQAMRWTGHPFAHHTVGSSMAVRRRTYLAQGGMNTRQAGEDFYFLQKCIELGSFSVINTTVVYPSARVSSRVPFGTGRAMTKLEKEESAWLTTNFEIFKRIKPLFTDLGRIYEAASKSSTHDEYTVDGVYLDQELLEFLHQIKFMDEVRSIRQHTSNFESFRKRFFRYFNAFMMIRCTHFLTRHYFEDVPVAHATEALARELNLSIPLHSDDVVLLQLFRSLDLESRV